MKKFKKGIIYNSTNLEVVCIKKSKKHDSLFIGVVIRTDYEKYVIGKWYVFEKSDFPTHIKSK